jgi:hypothetical protein
MGRHKEDPVARFHAKYIIDEHDCWRWQASKNWQNYGWFGLSPAKTVLAHRFAYELLVGPIPAGLEIFHTCHNHDCVNPRHMKLLTHAACIKKGVAEGRRRSNKPTEEWLRLGR